jgi:hypothetical protein
MKIKLPKTPSYEAGQMIKQDRFWCESNKSAPVVLAKFVRMGPAEHFHAVEGIECFGHTEVWEGSYYGGDWDGGYFQGHIFFPHGRSPDFCEPV